MQEIAGHDINYISITAALNAIRYRDRPSIPLNLVGDYGAGALYFALGMLVAILHARETGTGQVVNCARSDGVISLLSLFSATWRQGTWKDER